MKRNEMMMKRIEFFYSNNKKVHISLENNKFYNGIIVRIEHDLLILRDQVLGETPIFYNEINEIEGFRISTGNEGVEK